MIFDNLTLSKRCFRDVAAERLNKPLGGNNIEERMSDV